MKSKPEFDEFIISNFTKDISALTLHVKYTGVKHGSLCPRVVFFKNEVVGIPPHVCVYTNSIENGVDLVNRN